MKNEIVIIDYGAGNVQSVRYAFERMGIQPVLSNDPQVIRSAEKVLFPGVGHAQAAMDALKANGLDALIPTLTQPVLGICLGMQLLGSKSEEGNTQALGVIQAPVVRFQTPENSGIKIPHMGWNTISCTRGNPLLEGITADDYFYFVHTYYMSVCEDTAASAHYINDFTAVVNRGNFYGCQFHPEKSAAAGEKILKNFLNIKP